MKLISAGDVIPTRELAPDGELPRGALAAIERLRAADIAIGTLETAITDRGLPTNKVVCYRSPVHVVDSVVRLGLDVVSLANNQTLNYGIDGLKQTIELLAARGIRCVGAGHSEAEAWMPALVTSNGLTVAIVGFTCVAPIGWAATSDSPGLAAIRVRTSYEVDARWEQEEPGVAPRVGTRVDDVELARVLQAVERATSAADMVVAIVHWGVGSTSVRADYQAQLADELVRAGVSIILGGHSPHMQGIDVLDDALVCFSQGTFMRQQPRPSELASVYASMPKASCLLEFDIAGPNSFDCTVLPTVLGDGDISGFASNQEVAAILDVLGERSSWGNAQTERSAAGMKISIS